MFVLIIACLSPKSRIKKFVCICLLKKEAICPCMCCGEVQGNTLCKGWRSAMNAIINWNEDIKPIFIQESVYFMRDEKNEYKSLRLKYLPKLEELFLDKMSAEILELSDGERTINEIAEELIVRHGYQDSKRVHEDTLRMIDTFYGLQMVKVERSAGNMSERTCINEMRKYERLEPDNIRELLEYLDDEKDILYMDHLKNISIYKDELYLRDVMFNFTEDFYVTRDARGNITALFSIRYYRNVDVSYGMIGIVKGDVSLSLELIKGVLNSLREDGINKIKIQEVEQSKELEMIIEHTGFQYEYLAQKEYRGMDVTNYYKLVGEK